MQSITVDRMKALRKRRGAAGLVPLRITEIWCTEEQRAELKQKIAKLVSETLRSIN
jgi:hypothetical protein